MFVTYSLDSFHDNYNMPDSFYERFRLTRPELNRPGPADGIVTISRAQMSLLIDGLDWRAAKARSVAKPLFIV